MNDLQSAYVTKDYEIDPKFEDVVPDGTYLANGMIVLVYSHHLRGDLERMADDPDEKRRVEKNNRWMTVSYLRFQSDVVTFVGVYGDGTKQRQRFAISWPWIVKKDSLPEKNNKYERIHKIVEIALNDVHTPREELLDNTTRRLIEILFEEGN